MINDGRFLSINKNFLVQMWPPIIMCISRKENYSLILSQKKINLELLNSQINEISYGPL